ncbi:MAG: DOMON-like domain-containing protein [Candidatus Binatia bacterium]|nr:DOMON-like domain-containing protein [Candidatus Binatia bacterium]
MLIFVLDGDLTSVRIPAPRPPGRADGLWQHTCFEAFLRYPGEPEYCELNFAPSGQWAAYRFQRYREGMSPVPEVQPRLTVGRTEGRLHLEAVVHLQGLPLGQPHSRLQLALAAVVEDVYGHLSYWALRHPPGRPDFHHPAAFALELVGPDVS